MTNYTLASYYPFGMTMPGRNTNPGDYRYGFQNQETDPEMLGGAVAFKYRVHDPRIGRFLSVDPLSASYPHNSPYAFSENDVIRAVELEGLEKHIVIIDQFANPKEPKIHVIPYNAIFPGKETGELGGGTAYYMIHSDGNVVYQNYVAPGNETDEMQQLIDFSDNTGKILEVTEVIVGESDVSRFATKGARGIKILFTGYAVAEYAKDGNTQKVAEVLAEETISMVVNMGAKGGLLGIVMSEGVNIIISDSKREDGLTNLSNGRAADGYKMSARQWQGQLNKGFNTSYNTETWGQKQERVGKEMEDSVGDYYQPNLCNDETTN